MSRLLISIAIVVCIVTMSILFYFYRNGILFPSRRVPFDRSLVLTRDFEEELTFFLVTKLNIYEGHFEILDLVNLNVHNVAGADYVLITLRAPDGRICQVTAKRVGRTEGKWEFDDKNFAVIGLGKYEPSPIEEDTWLITSLSQDLEKNKLYSLLESDILKGSKFDLLGASSVHADKFLEFQNLPTRALIAVNEDKKIGFSNELSKGTQGADMMWVPDYPSQYSGPGYRAYLYERIKSKR